jgi:hypothetical protein
MKLRLRWKLFKLKRRAKILSFCIKYYDTLVAFTYQELNAPYMFKPIPPELLSENAPQDYQDLWDEYVIVCYDISELQSQIK